MGEAAESRCASGSDLYRLDQTPSARRRWRGGGGGGRGGKVEKMRKADEDDRRMMSEGAIDRIKKER